jgi:anti-anti-sigma factor
MNPLAQISVQRHGEVVVAAVRGEIDASNATWAGTRLRALLTNHSEKLTIDLSETTYLDSAGIALLFGLAEELRVHQQQLHLVVPEQAGIVRMLTISGLAAAVRTHTSLEAALGELDPTGNGA